MVPLKFNLIKVTGRKDSSWGIEPMPCPGYQSDQTLGSSGNFTMTETWTVSHAVAITRATTYEAPFGSVIYLLLTTRVSQLCKSRYDIRA
jgi:hypothetical protein